MKILVFDLETTGLLEDKSATIVELGAALWDTKADRIVHCISMVIDSIGSKPISPEITAINGISTECAREHGTQMRVALERFDGHAIHADALMARNGLNFDVPFLRRTMADEAFTSVGLMKPLIDDMVDVPYPKSMRNCTLSHVAADHGFLNPFPHSAMGDVMTLIRVMQIGKYDMEAAFKSAQSPVVEVLALVSFGERNLAKAEKFNWDGDRKVWHKKMRQHAYEQAAYKFATDVRML